LCCLILFSLFEAIQVSRPEDVAAHGLSSRQWHVVKQRLSGSAVQVPCEVEDHSLTTSATSNQNQIKSNLIVSVACIARLHSSDG